MKLFVLDTRLEDFDRTVKLAVNADEIESVQELPDSTPEKPMSRVALTGGDDYVVLQDAGTIAERISENQLVSFLNSSLGIFFLTTLLVTLGGALVKWSYGRYVEQANLIAQEKLLLTELDFRISQLDYRRQQIQDSHGDAARVVGYCLYIYRIVYGDVPSQPAGTFHSLKPEFQKESMAAIILLLSVLSRQPQPAGVLTVLSDMEMEKGEVPSAIPQRIVYPPGLLESRLKVLHDYSQTQRDRIEKFWWVK
jgi:uncharacterized protein YlzI (FlbEa/FlbD family)